MAAVQSPMLVVQAVQQQQQQQLASQPASQPAPPLQTAAHAPAAANGSSSHDPSKTLRMAESAAQHEAYYKAKMQEAQVSYDVIGVGVDFCWDTVMHQTQALCSSLYCICSPASSFAGTPCCIAVKCWGPVMLHLP